MTERFDVIVVGARCGGSALARLIARAGLRTLVIDRAAFPSDTGLALFVHWRSLVDDLHDTVARARAVDRDKTTDPVSV